ncbi:MAG: DUF3256 family protein [Muribaculaceae bacterium]|nr:DUF3256 family protein [Muribaculaceae bacterium]
MTFNLKLTAAAIAILAALLPLTAAARTAADFFLDAPAALLPLLDRNTRLDMIDYHANGFQTPSKNLFNGQSRITSSDDCRIEVQLSRDAAMQIAVIPSKSDTIIAVIETVHTPVPDSRITLYDTAWKPLRRQPAMPDAKAFIEPARRAEAAAMPMPPMCFVRADYNPATGLFTFRNSTVAYYAESDRPEILELMRGTVDMRYNGKRFVEASLNTER